MFRLEFIMLLGLILKYYFLIIPILLPTQSYFILFVFGMQSHNLGVHMIEWYKSSSLDRMKNIIYLSCRILLPTLLYTTVSVVCFDMRNSSPRNALRSEFIRIMLSSGSITFRKLVNGSR